jgi:large subunit ribosomal protein L3
MNGLLGQKVGMTAVFDESGRQIPITVIQTEGNVVVDKKTTERDGYNAVVLGYGERTTKGVNAPLLGFYKKQGIVSEVDGRATVKRHLREFRVDKETLDGLKIGETIQAANLFTVGEVVDVVGTSKGRGFTGVMKRYNFRGGKATHGVHEYYRHGGSIGSNTTPARVFKNKKMPGHHGNARTTIQNVVVVDVREEAGLVLLRGGVPGPRGGLVMLTQPVKKTPGF